MNDFKLNTRRRFVKAAVRRGAGRRLAVLVAAVLIATSVSEAPARADTRDVRNIGLPLVLPLTPAQLANDRRFRQTFGFRSDDAYIATIYDQVARDVLPGASRNWAALLTADEDANMTRRQQLAEVVGPSPLGPDNAHLTAFGRLLRSRIGQFGGEYFDQLADGAVVVLVTSNAADFTATLAPILGSRADHLRVLAAAHTYQELLTLTQRLADDSAWLKDHGVVLSSFGPDVASNTVVARVAAVTDAVKGVLQSRYPGAPVRAVEAPPVRTTGANDLQSPPMMGGLGMWRCDSSACLSAVGCSSGFIVNNGGSTPTYAVMGAGHCGGGFDWVQGTPYSGGQYTVGDTATANFGTLGDAEVIPLFAQQDGTHAPLVYLSTTSCGLGCTQQNERVIAGSETSTTVGELTCASRTQEADEICGSVTAVDQCVFYQAENTTVCHQIFANFPDTFGDSGGPYYQPQVSTGTSIAQGIASGSDLQTMTTYTQIAAAFAAISSAGGGSWSLQQYNRSAAVAYADQWTSNTESPWNEPAMRNVVSYPDFPNDCTNFASQVLYAGGMPTQGARDLVCYPQEWWKPYTVFGNWKYPHTWSIAECQRQRMSGYPTQYQLWASSEIYSMQGGDILQVSQDWGPTPTHSRVIIGPGYDSTTGIYEAQLISQHTTDRKRVVWNYAFDPSWPLWNWHVVW